MRLSCLCLITSGSEEDHRCAAGRHLDAAGQIGGQNRPGGQRLRRQRLPSGVGRRSSPGGPSRCPTEGPEARGRRQTPAEAHAPSPSAVRGQEAEGSLQTPQPHGSGSLIGLKSETEGNLVKAGRWYHLRGM